MWLSYGITTAIALILGYGQPRVLLTVAIITAPALVLGRTGSHAVEKRLRRNRVRSRTLIVGGGEIARHLVSSLDCYGDYGLEVVGAVDDSPKFGQSELGTRILGRSPMSPTSSRHTRSRP